MVYGLSAILATASAALVTHTQDEIDDDGHEQDDCEDSGTETIVKASLAAHANTLGAPVVGEEGIDHGQHGDDGEQQGGDLGRGVAKVEHANSQRAEDDGKVEPGEEGALIGEEDLGFDASG